MADTKLRTRAFTKAFKKITSRAKSSGTRDFLASSLKFHRKIERLGTKRPELFQKKQRAHRTNIIKTGQLYNRNFRKLSKLY